MSEPYLVESVTFTIENGIPTFTFITQLEERLTNLCNNFSLNIIPISTNVLRQINPSPDLVIPKDAELRIEFSFDDIQPGVTLWDIYVSTKETIALMQANKACQSIAIVVKDTAGKICYGPIVEKPYLFDWSGISGISVMMRINYAMAGQEFPKQMAENFIKPMHSELNEKGYLTGMYTELGRLYRHLENYDKSIEMYIKEIKGATRSDGSFGKQATIAFNNLGVVYKKQLQIEKAIDAFKVAISMNPNYFEAHTSIAGCFFEDINQNVKYFARAFRIRPDEQLWNHIVHSYSQAYRISPQAYFNRIQEEANNVDLTLKSAFDLDAFLRLKLPL